MKKLALFSLAVAAVAAMLFTTTGCETEKLEDAKISISPSAPTVKPGGSVKFTASGGWLYQWSVTDGTLSSSTGESVIYTAPLASETNVYKTATITVHASTTTNSACSASAVITIKD